jgi:hypothetical protein
MCSFCKFIIIIINTYLWLVWNLHPQTLTFPEGPVFRPRGYVVYSPAASAADVEHGGKAVLLLVLHILQKELAVLAFAATF